MISMSKHFTLLVLVSFSLATQARIKGNEANSTLVDGTTRFAGTIYKNNDLAQLRFDLAVGNSQTQYLMAGQPKTKGTIIPGTIPGDLIFDTVSVKKMVDGAMVAEMDNGGSIHASLRVRQVNGIFAGVPVTGEFLQGAINDGLFFEGGDPLKVDGQVSSGVLNYHSIRKFYEVDSGLKFGAYKITATKDGRVLDYFSPMFGDNYYNVQMNFGDLVVTGTISFADQGGYDSEGNSYVVATTGTFDLMVKHADGRDLELSPSAEGETEDERALLALMAYWELMVFDTFAE